MSNYFSECTSVLLPPTLAEVKECINRRGILSGDDSSGKYLVWFGSYMGDSNRRETLQALRPPSKDVFIGRQETSHFPSWIEYPWAEVASAWDKCQTLLLLCNVKKPFTLLFCMVKFQYIILPRRYSGKLYGGRSPGILQNSQ